MIYFFHMVDHEISKKPINLEWKKEPKPKRAWNIVEHCLVCVCLDKYQVWFPSRLIHCVWKAQYNTISQACKVSDTPFHTLRRDPGTRNTNMDHRLILIKAEGVYGHLKIEDVKMRCQKQIFILNHCNYTLRMRRINWTVWPLISARQACTCSSQPVWNFLPS